MQLGVCWLWWWPTSSPDTSFSDLEASFLLLLNEYNQPLRPTYCLGQLQTHFHPLSVFYFQMFFWECAMAAQAFLPQDLCFFRKIRVLKRPRSPWNNWVSNKFEFYTSSCTVLTWYHDIFTFFICSKRALLGTILNALRSSKKLEIRARHPAKAEPPEGALE